MGVRRFSPVRATVALLERDDMRALGIERTTRIARGLNARRWEPQLRARRRNLARDLAVLEREREGSEVLRIELRDGWARDESRSLPHLDRLLEQMDEVIEERGLRPWEHHGKPWLKDILPERSWERYESILDFACAPDVLIPLAHHAGFVPVLSGSLPPGVRLMESSTRFDPQPEGPWRSSQLWHIDYHSYPTLYVIVALRDIGPDDGPLHFLGEEASRRVSEQLRYRSGRARYRVSDEEMSDHVEPSEVNVFTATRGTALFIDSSRCFHFGSRNPASPRYQFQYAFVSPIRNDFSERLRPQADYPVRGEDSFARRLALDRGYLG